MRQRLMQVLGSPEPNDEMTDVVRRFWTRAKPLARSVPGRVESSGAFAERQDRSAQVIDLATWSRMQRAR